MSTAFFRKATSLQDHLVDIHTSVRASHPGVERIAVALYDAKTDTLRTFTHSSRGAHPLDHYTARLSDVPSLRKLADESSIRVLDSLGNTMDAYHTRAIGNSYRSSLTVPFYSGELLSGFIFFNGHEPGYFTKERVAGLSLIAELICSLVIDTMKPIEMLTHTIRVAKDVSHYRDEETGSHLDRVSNYARLIALGLADDEELDDEFIQMVFLFAPLHDLGKVAIPDAILLKPGPLDSQELEIMRSHTTKGLEICERILSSMDFVTPIQSRMLRNVVYSHHECWDGSGYPAGIAGNDIPLEAAIVSVADVFDALTSLRPYKPAWDPEDAFGFLSAQAGTKFHPQCVRSFVEQKDAIMDIRARFLDDEDHGKDAG